MFRNLRCYLFLSTKNLNKKCSNQAVVALRSKKSKSEKNYVQYFADSKIVRTVGGKGGNGCISFLQIWCNDRAGPDGGDGGNGGHVIFEACKDISNLNQIKSLIKANDGEKGTNKDCHGKNADHTIIKIPIGTIVKNPNGEIVADLHKEELKFIAARGGIGGKGNHFFVTDSEQSPQICEYGGTGEDLSYRIELRSIADIGLIGLPNAGKSTLLQMISRARPKVAPYPFTTLRPHIGMINFSDYEQISVADLPGLIKDSHKNKGLGIQFLKHAERCSILVFILDGSNENLFEDYKVLLDELRKFSSKMILRPKLIVINKIDLITENFKHIEEFENKVTEPIIKISAKFGNNVENFLQILRNKVLNENVN